jgi:hypothetical protein
MDQLYCEKINSRYTHQVTSMSRHNNGEKTLGVAETNTSVPAAAKVAGGT